MADGFDRLIELIGPVADGFSERGHHLYFVGGIVRDQFQGRGDDLHDLDLTTDARPEQIKAILSPLADALWAQGERFGTIGAKVDGEDVEITTYRAEQYQPDSRKPEVAFGDSLRDDLARRDFTINAMAVDAMTGELVDPFGGRDDLDRRILRTPLDPEISFREDPLRMLRAARFVARDALQPDPALHEAMVRLAPRMEIISVERIRDELQKLLLTPDPAAGIDMLIDTGVLDQSVEWLPRFVAGDTAARIAKVSARPASRWAAALFEDRPSDGDLRRLRMKLDLIATIRWLIASTDELYGDEPSDADLRRSAAGTPDGVVIEDGVHFGQQLGLGDGSDRLSRIAELRSAETDLDAPRPVLGGQAIQAALGVEPGPVIGQATKALLEQRYLHGPLSADQAEAFLQSWSPDQS